jgi:quercetin dioxygenase-like cupin family protein
MGAVKKQLKPDYDWENCTLVEYGDSDTVKGISKRILIGEEDGATDFFVRYFNVQPGGNSVYEHHPWVHEVFILRGRGTVLLGDTWHDVEEGDVVFIGTDEQHQLKAAPDEYLGFLCVAARP